MAQLVMIFLLFLQLLWRRWSHPQQPGETHGNDPPDGEPISPPEPHEVGSCMDWMRQPNKPGLIRAFWVEEYSENVNNWFLFS